MRYYGYLFLIGLMAIATVPVSGASATFGTVVPVGGQASDAALDESRGLLYIANFTANRIDVMSTATNSIQTSINVAPQPGSLTLSRDSQYLLVAHFNNTTPPVPSANLLTLIHLADNTQQTFITGDAPLGVAFFSTVPDNGAANLSGPGKALVVTTSGFYILDPTTGVLSVAQYAWRTSPRRLPSQVPTFPGQILQTALATSGDGTVIWGIGGAGTGSQIIYQFHSLTNSLYAEGVCLCAAAPAACERLEGWLLRHGRLDLDGFQFRDAVEISQRDFFHQRHRACHRFDQRHYLRTNPRCNPATWPTIYVQLPRQVRRPPSACRLSW